MPEPQIIEAEAVTVSEMLETINRPAATSLEIAGPRKAAILVLAMGEEMAGEIFRQMGEEEVQQVAAELARMDYIPAETADRVIEEFHLMMTGREQVSTSGMDYAQRLLHRLYGSDNARRMLELVNRSLESPTGLEALQKADPSQLSRLFQNEHPQTTALVLAHLPPNVAAETLKALPVHQHTDVIERMARLQAISNDVIRRISVVMDQKLRKAGTESRQTVGGVQSVANLCNRLDRGVTQALIEQLDEKNPELAVKIRSLMVTFEDLKKVDDGGIREILQRVDKKVLTLALKGTTEELQSRFFSNMSSKAVEMMREEMDYMGQVKLKDVTGAQREIVEIMRELDEQGAISLSGSGDNEYVS
jgi:flagellar motor switch protein FliG